MAIAVMVPIAAVSVTMLRASATEARVRAYDRLEVTAVAAAGQLLASEAAAARRAHELATSSEFQSRVDADADDPGAALREAVEERQIDFLVVTTPTGEVRARASRVPQFASRVQVPEPAQMARRDGEPSPLAAVSRFPLAGGGELVAGTWRDRERLAPAASTGAGITLVELGDGDPVVVASTAGLVDVPTRVREGVLTTELGGRMVNAVLVPMADTGLHSLATAPAAPTTVRPSLVLGLVLFMLALTALVVLLSSIITSFVTAPVGELVAAANGVAAGDLGQRVSEAGDRELAALGQAFNRMTQNLREQVSRVEEGQRQLRTAMDNIGDALTSTHDIEGIVDVAVEAAELTLRADDALFFERVALPARLRAMNPVGGDGAIELDGSGVAGAAAASGQPVVYPPLETSAGSALTLAPGEPAATAALAVPLYTDAKVFGVLAVYRRAGEPFGADDVQTLSTLVRQAGVAIGNVLLHQETRRQARTDPLTLLWNRREFEARCREAIRESERYDDPFGVIIVDIDEFKLVNDSHGHAVGDAVLIWVAGCLADAVREIDAVARWGGEEFIVLLPRASVEETRAVAERIRASVAEEPYESDGLVLPITVSAGYAGYPDDGTTPEALFNAADGALLRAKRLGRDRVERASLDT